MLSRYGADRDHEGKAWFLPGYAAGWAMARAAVPLATLEELSGRGDPALGLGPHGESIRAGFLAYQRAGRVRP